ncbi:MAG: hypothetical protein AAGF92_01325 [Myxococcota bacterium]
MAEGLRGSQAGERTAESLLVSMLVPRLERLGIEVPGERFREPEHSLYRLLREPHGDDTAYSRYNALLGRLESFANALECEIL